MKSSRQKVGLEFERIVHKELLKRGFDVAPKPDFNEPNCDMIVNSIPVEVKGANQTFRRFKHLKKLDKKRPRWQWYISETSQDMNGVWVLILLAVDQWGDRFFYIVPGQEIGERSHLQLTSHPDGYSGFLAQWQDEWDVLRYLSQQSFGERPNYWDWKRDNCISPPSRQGRA